MVSLRTLLACAALIGAAPASAAYEFYVKVKAAAQQGRDGPVFLFVEDRTAGGKRGAEGVVRIVCTGGSLRSAALLWSGGSEGKMISAPKIGEATAITSIGLPKITPKIAKESHGRVASSADGWSPIEFGDPAAACRAATEAAKVINTSRSHIKG